MCHWLVERRANLRLTWRIIDLRLALYLPNHWFLSARNKRLILCRKRLLMLSTLNKWLRLTLYCRLIIILSFFFINYHVLRFDRLLLKALNTWILNDTDPLALWFSFYVYFVRGLNAWHRRCLHNRLI